MENKNMIWYFSMQQSSGARGFKVQEIASAYLWERLKLENIIPPLRGTVTKLLIWQF